MQHWTLAGGNDRKISSLVSNAYVTRRNIVEYCWQNRLVKRCRIQLGNRCFRWSFGRRPITLFFPEGLSFELLFARDDRSSKQPKRESLFIGSNSFFSTSYPLLHCYTFAEWAKEPRRAPSGHCPSLSVFGRAVAAFFIMPFLISERRLAPVLHPHRKLIALVLNNTCILYVCFRPLLLFFFVALPFFIHTLRCN